MKASTIAGSVLGSVVLLAATGCTGGGGATVNPVDANSSDDVGGALVGQLDQSTQLLEGVPLAPFTGTCNQISGDTSDADADLIPADATITESDCVMVNGTTTITANGSISVRDDEPATRAWAFTQTLGVSVKIEDSGATSNATLTGTRVGSHPGGSFQTAENLSENVVQAAQGQTMQANEDVNWTTNYAPSSSWLPGDPVVAGTFTVDGGWSVAITGGDGALYGGTMTIATPTPLTVDPSCFTYVSAGELTASMDGGARVLTIDWIGCDDYTVTYTGP
jgi:hypothetical protein